MENIYDILSKHFLGEISTEEEKILSTYKKENAKEYEILKELWKRDKIEIKEFDSQSSWKRVLSIIKKERKEKRKVVWMYSRLKYIAAIAAILVTVGTFSTYHILENINSHKIQIVQYTNNQKIEKIVLNDGTKIWLSNSATIKYPKRFSGDKRTIELEGKGFFEVAKDQKRPFKINTANSCIEVFGTSFNVNSTTKETTVNVATGKVLVSSLNNVSYEVITPGMSAIVAHDVVKANQTKEKNYLAWKTGEFVFENTPLAKVVNDLNTFYTKPIKIGSQELIAHTLSVNFNNAEIEEVLEVILLACAAKVVDKGDHFLIK